MKKRFAAPLMEVQRLVQEDVLTDSTCRTQALGCTSCYCTAIGCDDYHPECPGCYNDLGF